MIEVELPDGTVAEFPDGTPNDVIQRVLAQQFGGPQQPVAPEVPITDLPAVRASLAPEDKSDWSWPERPNSGLIDYARVIRPELADVPDQQLASAIRQAGYPDMPADEFYRQTGYGDRFGYDTSVPSAADGMSGLQRLLAGAGKSFVDTAQGLRQAGTDAAFGLARGMAGRNEFRQALRQQQAPIQQRQTDEATDRRVVDAALMDTGAGITGNVAGTLAQLLGPGYLARGTGAAAALLPRTAVGNIAQGAALGAAQPVAEGDSRAMNAGLGGLLGGAGYAATAVPGAIARQVGQLSPAISHGMQERAAAQVIEQFATDPAAVRVAAANPVTLVPGSMPTLAEASGDVGLAGLQRTLANTPEFGADLFQRQQANNAARVRSIESGFGGADDAAATGIRQSANARAGRMLRPVEGVPLENKQPIADTIDKLLERHRAKPAVRAALEEVKSELGNVATVGDAHGLRQYIGQLMGGNIEGKASGKLAQFELGTVRGVLDRQMRQAFPEWGDFLRGHREAMKQADQATIGADLLATGRAVRESTGDPVLQPASFARAANRVDRPLNRSQRMKFASLTDAQRETIDTVRRDLERQARAQTDGKAIGSNTVQNAIGGNTLQSAAGPVGAAMVEPVSGVAMLAINQLRKTYGERTMAVVQEVMLDPARANEVLGRLPSRQRRAAMSAIRQLPKASGLAVRAATPSVLQGGELDR